MCYLSEQDIIFIAVNFDRQCLLRKREIHIMQIGQQDLHLFIKQKRQNWLWRNKCRHFVSSMDTYCRNFYRKKCELDEKDRSCLDLFIISVENKGQMVTSLLSFIQLLVWFKLPSNEEINKHSGVVDITILYTVLYKVKLKYS